MMRPPAASGFGLVAIAAAALFLALPAASLAEERCEPVTGHPVKIEAWMSKRYEGNLREVRGELAAMGHTRVALWVYPAENPSRVVAIGRCVPAYIARHALRQALQYGVGAASLVHQGFISDYWIGLGTSLFAEDSQQKISAADLDRLLDENLDTPGFQALYRELARQDEKVQAFGLLHDNPKRMR